MPSLFRLPRRSGFTLIEVLISLGILLIVMVVLMQFMTGVDAAWKSAAADPFAEAQDAFETVAHHLAAATLAPYEDYADGSGAFRTSAAFVPNHLARRSDLDFVCGPGAGTNGLLTASGRTTSGSSVFFLEPGGTTQTDAHAGLEHLLNATGYFVEFGDDTTAPSFILPQTHAYRWRLKQVTQPAESLQIFAGGTSSSWVQSLVASTATLTVLAENVVTLLILPEPAANDSGATFVPTFKYDSRDTTNLLTLHQLPPRVRLVLVAMDPASALRLAAQEGSSAPQLVAATLFQQAAQVDADLATLDASLTTQKIGHRIFQRDIILPSSSWSDTPSP
jgi:uncharacterized protein (TIGR02599 family)